MTIPESRGVVYALDGEPVEPGEHELETPGEARVTAEAESGGKDPDRAADPDGVADPDPDTPAEKPDQDPEPSEESDPAAGEATLTAADRGHALAVTGSGLPLLPTVLGGAGVLLGAVLFSARLFPRTLRGRGVR